MTNLKVYHTLEELEDLPKGVHTHVTLGVFDGIHLGHRVLLTRVKESTTGTQAIPAVFTFCNHPLSILAPAYVPPLLTTEDMRIEIFASLGIKIAVIVPFDHTLADLSPEEFAREILFKRLRARRMVCGYNFCFGRGGAGDMALLCKVGQDMGFVVEQMEPVMIRNVIVSSTRIREYLSQGMVDAAAEFLGRPYAIRGIVEKGMGRGQTLNYPTANLAFPQDLLIPATGVYAVRIVAEDRIYQGMMNIGYSPTFPPERFSAEAHLFDFQGDLSGKRLEVKFISRMRDEAKFDAMESLARQLKKDEKIARQILS